MANSNTMITSKGAIFIGSQLSSSRSSLMKAQSQLSSGLKNPDPATDPSAATLSLQQDGNISVAGVVGDIVEQAQAITQLAVGVLQSMATLLNRLKELGVSSTSATIDDTNRGQLNAEYQQLVSQLSLNSKTSWGSNQLFTGQYQNLQYQVGINSTEFISVSFDDLSTDTIGVTGGAVSDISTAANAAIMLPILEAAQVSVLNSLATVASYHERLEVAGDNMTILSANLQSVVSTYRDVDVADALTEAQRQSGLVMASGTALSANLKLYTDLSELIRNTLGR